MKKICSIVICVCYILSFASCSLTKNINHPNVETEQLLQDSDLFEKVSETKTLNGICVSYKQKHQGLEVFNSFVTKTIDNAGNIEFVGEYYDFSLLSAIDFKNIDVSPEWLKKYEAEGVSVSPNTTSVSPVLYITDKNEVVQALRFTVKIYDDNDINEFLLVTSLNGDTVYYYENFYNNFDTGLVSNGYETIEVMCDAENYYGISKNHYYYVWNRTSTEREDIEKDLTENGFAFNKENIYKNKSQNWSEKYSNLVFNSMSVMNNIEDFWASEYGYHGIDGNRNYAKLIVVDEHLSGTAMCGGRYSIILGTTKDGKYSVSEAPEILAHEFTHGVLKNYCHLKSSDESGALHEAICDVFGVVYSNNTNWKLAEKLSSYGISKDIPAHKRTMDDFEYDDYIIDLRYWDLGKLVKFGNSSDNYVHKNSYILSNTLYEISKNVFDNDLNAFGKIMFNSLRYLPSNAGFSEFRRAFEASVEDLYNNKTARECSKYFEKSGIECSDEFFVKTTVNSITGVPNTQSSQTTPTLEVITNENVTIPTVSTTDATASKPVTDENKDDLKELYRKFFFDEYTNENLVYLFDVTHDGKEDMIVFEDNPQTNASFDEYIVYAVVHGEVKEIYRAGIPINRTNIMLVETDSGSNIVYEFRGIWQGIGAASCKEFYLTDSGEMKQVNLIEQEYGGDQEVLDSIYLDSFYNDSEAYFNYIDENYELADKEYYGKIEQRYGSRFSKAYKLYSTGDMGSDAKNATVETF